MAGKSDRASLDHSSTLQLEEYAELQLGASLTTNLSGPVKGSLGLSQSRMIQSDYVTHLSESEGGNLNDKRVSVTQWEAEFVSDSPDFLHSGCDYFQNFSVFYIIPPIL